MTIGLIVKGGTVWTPSGMVRADVVVEGERIAAVVDDASARGLTGGRVIDATERVVIPGLIDTHTHHRDPGFTHKEDVTTATRAAAAGGVTMSVGMPNVQPPTVTAEQFAALVGDQAKRAIVDFNHNPSPTRVDEIHELSRLGCLAYKLFMIADTKRSYPHIPALGVHDSGELLRVAEKVAETGKPLMVHPHDQRVMDVIEGQYWGRGEYDYMAYARAYRDYGGLVFDSAIGTLVQIQRSTGVRLHVLHLNTEEGVRLVRRAKAAGRRVTGEVNPWALFSGGPWEELHKHGPYALGVWVPPDDQRAVWDGVHDGTIDVCGTDHAPHTREEKEVGWKRMWEAAGGMPCVQDYLSLFLTEVHRGRMTLDEVVRLCSHNVARVFGLYPRKGVIQVGADADLAVLDLNAEREIRNEDAYSRCGWTRFHGHVVTGIPIYTVVRGKVVMEHGKVVGEPGWGKFVPPVDGGSR